MSLDLLSQSNSFSSRSPRISFSHELVLSSRDEHATVAPMQHPNIDFDFCTFYQEHESLTADELFLDGKLIPLQNIVQTPNPASNKSFSSSLLSPPSLEKEISKQDKQKMSINAETDEKQNFKSFWKFKRSRSFGGGSGGGYGRSLCPLPLLSRSNSTGSPLNSHKQQNSQKKNVTVPSSVKSCQKPPLRKSSLGNHGSNVRVDPVLHVSAGNLFGFGSLFMTGKDKRKRR